MRTLDQTAQVVLFSFLLLAMALPPAVGAEVIVLRAGRLLDVESGAYRSDALIKIEDGRIREIVDAGGKKVSTDWIDLLGFTVLPGLIDVHTHLCDNTNMEDAFDHWALPAASFGIAGVVNARSNMGTIPSRSRTRPRPSTGSRRSTDGELHSSIFPSGTVSFSRAWGGAAVPTARITWRPGSRRRGSRQSGNARIRESIKSSPTGAGTAAVASDSLTAGLASERVT